MVRLQLENLLSIHTTEMKLKWSIRTQIFQFAFYSGCLSSRHHKRTRTKTISIFIRAEKNEIIQFITITQLNAFSHKTYGHIWLHIYCNNRTAIRTEETDASDVFLSLSWKPIFSTNRMWLDVPLYFEWVVTILCIKYYRKPSKYC